MEDLRSPRATFLRMFRFKLFTGPCGVQEVAQKLRGDAMKGLGFDISEGTEHVYFSLFVSTDEHPYVADYATGLVKNLIGWAPIVVNMGEIK